MHAKQFLVAATSARARRDALKHDFDKSDGALKPSRAFAPAGLYLFTR